MTESDIDFSNIRPYPTPHRPDDSNLSGVSTLLKEITSGNMLVLLRRLFRGEGRVNYSDGTYMFVQVTKPAFVKVDFETNFPIKEMIKFKDPYTNEIIDKEVFIPNDEAIEEVLGMLNFLAFNPITPITNLDENTILDDLREFECKLAGVLCLKQKEWGIDKELLPVIMTKIKTIVQDARYMSCNGGTIRAIQKSVQRIEQVQEGTKQSRMGSTFYAR